MVGIGEAGITEIMRNGRIGGGGNEVQASLDRLGDFPSSYTMRLAIGCGCACGGV